MALPFLLGLFLGGCWSQEFQSIASPMMSTPHITNALLIDTFNDTAVNSLGFFHGLSGDVTFGEFQEEGTYLQVNTGNVDATFVTGLAEGCTDLTSYKDAYIHIQYNGSAKFSVSLQQHNKYCDDAKIPFPETWDSVQASRYSFNAGSDIFIPVSHFDVDLTRINGIALEDWYTNETTIFYKIEMLPASAVPTTATSVAKLGSGTLHVSCTQPNLIAFAIDDGSPEYLQRTLQIVKDEQIPVTFFVQGSALEFGVEDGNFTAGYQEMRDLGHQFGLHTMTHPHMEALQNVDDIDNQITTNMAIMKEKLGIETNYFRPPYGTVGARTRQALARHLHNPQIIMWSIDVMDWVYGENPNNDPQRMQYKSFENALNGGGDVVVLHYLYESTVDQLRDMIRLAKSKGRQFVRVDQCIGDKNAPETWGWKRA